MNDRKSKRYVVCKMIVFTLFSVIGTVIGSPNAAVVGIVEGLSTGCTMTDGNPHIVQGIVSFVITIASGSEMTVKSGQNILHCEG